MENKTKLISINDKRVVLKAYSEFDTINTHLLGPVTNKKVITSDGVMIGH